MRRALSAGLAISFALACDGAVETGPVAIELTVEPQRQWSGEPIMVRSPQLVGARDEDVTITMPDQRTEQDLAFLIDADRIGGDALEFAVPPLYSGTHEAILHIRGFQPAAFQFDVVGHARPPRGLLGAHGEPWHVLPLPPRHVLSAGASIFLPGARDYLVVDLDTGEREIIPGLESPTDGQEVMKMYVPGPSYRGPNHAVFDPTPIDSVGAEVWQTSPTFAKVATLPCGFTVSATHQDREYTAAELAPGRCLVLSRWGRLEDETGTVLADDPGLEYAEIRLAPGGRWALPVTRRCCAFGTPELSIPLPVISGSGIVAYTLPGYVEVPGADFSAEGDTLFVVGAKRPNGAEERTWSLDVLDAATGDPIRSVAFGSGVYLRAVLVDPVRPWLYVAGYGLNATPDHQLHWASNPHVFLAVLDRATLTPLAVVPEAGGFSAAGDGWLMFGGSSGQIHFLPNCGGDCGGVIHYAFDTQ
jgi:hypothetical protein